MNAITGLTTGDVLGRFEAHRRWLSDGSSGAQLDISVDPIDLATARAAAEAFVAALRASATTPTLRYARLRGLPLSDVTLSGAVLSNATLSDVDLSGACLDDARLLNAKLTRVRLARASATRATFGGNWYSCDADDARFARANFVKGEIFNTSFHRAGFVDAEMLGAEFYDCDLRAADFRGANLTRARFQSCDLRGADFTNATIDGAEFYRSSLAGVHGEPASSAAVHGEVYDTPPLGEAGAQTVEVVADEFMAGLRSKRWR